MVTFISYAMLVGVFLCALSIPYFVWKPLNDLDKDS